MVAAAIIGGSVLSAGIGAVGASSAAGKSAAASQQSAFLQLQQQQQNQVNQSPFISTGQYAANVLQGRIASGAIGTPMDLSGMPAPFTWNPTMAGLAATPGYQFQLQQGLMAQQNSASARGLGVSSAALRGAADYAEGLAGTTYNQQLTNALNIYGAQNTGFQNKFNDYWANQTNQGTPLQNLATMGENAAAGAGYSGVTAGAQIGNAVSQAGQAQAAGIMGQTNALSGAVNNVSSVPLLNAVYPNLFGGGSTVSPSSPNSDASIYNNAYQGSTL